MSCVIRGSAAYASLAEEVHIAAVRTPSTDRRRDLAALLRDGLSKPDVELLEERALLRLLEQLNDAQVLILMQHGSFTEHFGDVDREAFTTQHSNISSCRRTSVIVRRR